MEYQLLESAKNKNALAKERWRKSSHGKNYMRLYHIEYMTPEKKAAKLEKQKLRRKTSEVRQKIDKEYNFKYVRTEAYKTRKNTKRRERRRTDVVYRIQERLRGRIKDLLGRNKPEAVSRSLGCTTIQLIEHLESKFKFGMSWENYGFYGWHIDHIRPLKSFDLRDVTQYRKACHYTNLQPMWGVDNLKKGARVSKEQGGDDE